LIRVRKCWAGKKGKGWIFQAGWGGGRQLPGGRRIDNSFVSICFNQLETWRFNVYEKLPNVNI
jgi:hypothetical protein